MPNRPTKEKYGARDSDGCSQREGLFAVAYVRHRGNGPRAARDAGYHGDLRSRSSSLLRRPQVLRAIQRLTNEGLEKAGLSADRVVRELARIASADARACFDYKTGRLLDWKELDKDVAAAIQNFETTKDGKVVRVEFAPKHKAIDLLLQWLGGKGRIPDTVTEPLLRVHFIDKGKK